MTTSYSRILAYPGAAAFSAAGLVARFPVSMTGISTILAVQDAYGSYTAAGLVSAANIVAVALGSPLLARLVDAYGQSRVMLPAVLGSAAGLAGLAAATGARAPLAVLVALAVLAGALAGSMGSLVRARWTGILRTPQETHTAFSLEAALDEVTFIIGPVLATALCTAPVLPVTSGWLAALLLQVGGGSWFLSQRATEPAAHGRPGRAATPGGAAHHSVLRHGAVIVVIAVFLLSGAMFGANDVAAVAFATEQGHASASGVILAAWGVGSLTAALAYGSRSWGWPLRTRLLLGVVALAVGSSTFALAPNLVVLSVLMVLTGTAIAPTVVNGNNIIQVTVAASQLTEGLAWVSTALNIGVSLGALLAGSVIDAAGSRGGYLVMAACAWAAVAAAVAGTRVLRGARTRSTLEGQ
ncbi:MFS transporter [Actinomyces lilanjuaniae]|uniref:MFS transporter n=1 Tax=Actinomyces lilanjuaniae TaxID=2321394 RepID=A0ABN5PLI2_9ACTO|nr:MFS transporter [Actinomyces lilanjuaniae]AYD89056.1 MFS transporter [Actinomyces lilanjuaniae]